MPGLPGAIAPSEINHTTAHGVVLHLMNVAYGTMKGPILRSKADVMQVLGYNSKQETLGEMRDGAKCYFIV